jgi:hypothetical protein
MYLQRQFIANKVIGLTHQAEIEFTWCLAGKYNMFVEVEGNCAAKIRKW